MLKKKIESNKSNKTLWMPPSEGIRRVQLGDFAYHCEGAIAYNLIKGFSPEHICGLNEVVLQPKKMLGLLIKKGSPYGEIFREKYVVFESVVSSQ